MFVDVVCVVVVMGVIFVFFYFIVLVVFWWCFELWGMFLCIGVFCYGICFVEGLEFEGICLVVSLVVFVMDVLDDGVMIGIGSFDGLFLMFVGLVVGILVGGCILEVIGYMLCFV